MKEEIAVQEKNLKWKENRVNREKREREDNRNSLIKLKWSSQKHLTEGASSAATNDLNSTIAANPEIVELIREKSSKEAVFASNRNKLFNLMK